MTRAGVARVTGELVSDEHTWIVGGYGTLVAAYGSSGGVYLVVMIAYAVGGLLLVRERFRHRTPRGPACYGRHAACHVRPTVP